MTEDNFNENNLSLIAAVMGRDSAAVVASLGRGADIHHEDNFALRCAVYLGYPDMVELLLKNKANIHANGEDPLFSAVKARDNPMIEMLLTHGANPQAVINNKRRQLDKESLDIVVQIQSRGAKKAFEKHATVLKESPRKTVRLIIKPRAS